MDNSRKYRLDIVNYGSFGIGSRSETFEYNMLDEFITSNGVVYEPISFYDLRVLNKIDYDKRVSDFLSTIMIEDANILIEKSTYDSDECQYFSQINPEFIIYKFLNRMRIIDQGKTNTDGVLYYSFSTTNTPNWALSNTSTDLPIGKYYVSVGEMINGNIMFQETKEFDLK